MYSSGLDLLSFQSQLLGSYLQATADVNEMTNNANIVIEPAIASSVNTAANITGNIFYHVL